MKAFTPLIFLALAIAPSIFAQVPEYGQCGGENWTGSITCVAGCTCQSQNAWYSQCLPESNPTTSPTPSSTPSAPSYTPSPSGFVHTSGTKFTLNSATYTVVGANSYWVGLTGLNISEMNAAFADMAKAGATTVRTWGFNEVTSPSGIYYQSWSGSNSTINTGSTGLENFDNVVAAAKANGLRLIVTLTNNWSDYGGMDVYVNQILGSGQPHDYFYTNAQVIAAYQNYVHTFVSRYVDEPTIFAWELANEPRCAGSTSATSGTCTTQIITNWASNLSAYIKKIDSNHLVALGDEGFYNEPSAPTYPYQGGEGIDFNANLAISTLDFGTFHSYPLSWGQTSDPGDWGVQWIKDHVTSQNAYGKPVIMEEFGVTTNQTSVYTSWYETVVDSGLTGVLIWQAGSYLPSGTTPNDGFTIYPDSPVYQLELQYAAALKARD